MPGAVSSSRHTSMPYRQVSSSAVSSSSAARLSMDARRSRARAAPGAPDAGAMAMRHVSLCLCANRS